MGTDTIFDVRRTGGERSTSNAQLSTFIWVIERAQGGRNMGTDTEFGGPDFWPGGPDQAPVGRSWPAGLPDMGTDTVSGIPIRNVQRATFNSQLSTGWPKGRMAGRDMGTDTEFGRADFWPGGPAQAPVDWSRPAAAPGYGDRHDVRYTDQERSTWNVQLSTFNWVTERAHGGRDMGTDTIFGRPSFWLAGPGQAPVGRSKPAGRPDIGTDTQFGRPNFLAGGPDQARPSGGRGCRSTRMWGRHDVRYADQERSTPNVQRSTFNWVSERAHGGRDMGTDTLFGRPDSWPGGPEQALVGRSRPAVVSRYGDRHDVRCTDQERWTSKVQLSTFNGVSERAHGERDMGTDTQFGRPDSWPWGTWPSAPVGRSTPAGRPDMGTDMEFGQPNFWASGPDQARPSGGRGCRSTRMWGQTRCPICRSG